MSYYDPDGEKGMKELNVIYRSLTLNKVCSLEVKVSLPSVSERSRSEEIPGVMQAHFISLIKQGVF